MSTAQRRRYLTSDPMALTGAASTPASTKALRWPISATSSTSTSAASSPDGPIPARVTCCTLSPSMNRTGGPGLLHRPIGAFALNPL